MDGKHHAATVLGLICIGAFAYAEGWQYRNTEIRAGRSNTIVGTAYLAKSPKAETFSLASQHPQPRLAGFSPLVAITTSDAKSNTEFDWQHYSSPNFMGNSLTSPANQNFFIGIVDSGADSDLFAGTAAVSVGITGPLLTQNSIPVGGVGGQTDAAVTWPFGVFAGDLGAVSQSGTLDLNQVVGQWNVSALVLPPIICGGVEAVSGVLGRPFLSLFNAVINVDTPREVTVNGRTYKSPAVTMQSKSVPINSNDYVHRISLEFGGLVPAATTAIYYPDIFDLDNLEPIFPTLFALTAASIPTGGAFFTTLYVREGNGSEVALRVMVDTGAQTTILSSDALGRLNLPFQPDFTIDVCGVSGFVSGVPCYYIDYARLNALGGPLEFSQVPVVNLDLTSPEGGPLDGILGMNFFWNRNVVYESELSSTSALWVSAPLCVPFGDNDVDFDVDADDFESFVQAFSGDLATAPEFTHFDHNDDGDVGLEDLHEFQAAAGQYPATSGNCN